jgi:hypothetical protein
VAGIDSLVPVTRVRAMSEVVASPVAASRALTVLLLGFGSLAVIIGATGVYSLIAYIVSPATSFPAAHPGSRRSFARQVHRRAHAVPAQP